MSKNIVIILCALISLVASVAIPQAEPQPQTQMKSMQTPVRSTSVNEGMRLYRQKRYQQAIDEFNKVLQTEPNNAAAYYFSGYAHYVMGHHPEAIASFKKAFEADPSFDPRPYFRR
jgi:tetratricopeptide (TPR) repeat protein